MNTSGIDSAAKALLGDFDPDDSLAVDPLVQKALYVASELQKRAHVLQSADFQFQGSILVVHCRQHGCLLRCCSLDLVDGFLHVTQLCSIRVVELLAIGV